MSAPSVERLCCVCLVATARLVETANGPACLSCIVIPRAISEDGEETANPHRLLPYQCIDCNKQVDVDDQLIWDQIGNKQCIQCFTDNPIHLLKPKVQQEEKRDERPNVKIV